MKIYIPKNLGWYVAVAFIFGPLLLLYVVNPDWLARVISILLETILGPIVLLWVVFDKKITLLKDDSPLYKWFNKRKVYLFNKAVVLVFTIFVVKVVCYPVIKDVYNLVGTKNPTERTGTVTWTQQGLGLIFETVVLDSPVGTKENMFQAYYFAPRHIMQGNTYKFLYLPNSHFIIGAELVK